MTDCIDLFSGAGGLSCGFARAGFNISAAADHVEVFCATHRLNFPNSRTVLAEIPDLAPAEFRRRARIRKRDVRIVLGGPPCQTFSTIGLSKIRSVRGESVSTDPRNYLFKNYFEYVEYFQPDVFVLENVPTMRTRHGGRLFERLLSLVTSLEYRPHVAVLNSAEHGVPQNRNRLFVVGTKGNRKFRFPPPTHTEPEQSGGDQLSLYQRPQGKPFVTVGEAIGDLPQINDGARLGLLPYYSTEPQNDYQRIVRNPSGYVTNNVCRVSNARAKLVFPHMAPGSIYMDLPPEVRRILPFREDIFFDRLKRLDPQRPAWTVIAHIGMDGYMYIHPWQNRTLSVREAARLQGFPDSFVFTGNMREQYVQVGNAVPPLLAERLALCVKECL